MTAALIRIAAGAGASLALRQANLLESAGPLADTFAVLPLVVGLFAAADRLGATAGRPAPRFSSVRLLAAAALALVTLALDQLGLRYAQALGAHAVYAALIGLLAWQAYESLAGLDRKPTRARRAAFFLIALAVYAGVTPFSTGQRPPDGDEPYYLLLAHSLAHDFDADLKNNYEQGDSLRFMGRRIEPQPGDPVGPDGERFSRHNVLLPLLLAPFYRALGLAGALAVMALLAAALATTTLRIGELFFPELPKATLLAASVAALCPPLLLQSHQAWVEVPAALLVAIGFLAATRLRIEPASRLDAIMLLGAALLLPLLKLRFLALALPMVAISIARAPRARRTMLVRGLTLLLASAAVILLFNQASFGLALKHHSTQSLLTYLTSPVDYLAAPLGLLFDSGFGLLFAAPIWALALPGAWLTFRRRRDLFLDASVVCLPYLLLLGPRPEWYGGWAPTFRYGMVFLPFLALFLAPALAQRRSTGIRLLISVLAPLTIALALVWLLAPGWTYNFANGRSYLLDHLTTALGADVARLFPSFVRPRAANLIWPSLLIVTLFLAARSRRRTVRSGWTAGVAILLLSSAAVAGLSVALPTRVVEFEDPYVEKLGGGLWPELWAPSRVAYRGAWRLEPGDEVGAPIRSGGRELTLTLDVRRLGSVRSALTLEVFADDERLLLLPVPRSREWSTIRLDPLPWSTDYSSLRLRLDGPGGQLLLDRARLGWRRFSG